MKRRSLSLHPIFRVLLAFLVSVALLAPFASPLHAFAQTQARFDPTTCMYELPIGIQDGVQVKCGYLTVPADYQDEKKGTLRLAVAILKATGSSPAPDPLVMAQGGPGGSTIDTYGQLLFTSPLLKDRDIILFDQRGTLYSQPALYCTEMDALVAKTIEQDLSQKESERLNLQAMQECHDRLVKKGIDLSVFNSLENAEDIESLRQALNYQQINLYGVSYGTLLAQHYMRLHPSSLRSVILDAVVPTQTNFVLNSAQTLDQSLTRLFESCKADTACNAEFPDLEKVFFDLVDQLEQNPARLELTDSQSKTTYKQAVMDGQTFEWLIFQLLYSGDIIPLLPQMIYDVKNGDYRVVSAIMPLLVFDRSMSYGMYYSVLCAEDADFTPAEQNLEGVRPQIVESEKDQPQSFLDTCKVWQVKTLDPVVDEPVVSKIPTLLLSGAFDPITPPPYAETVAKSLVDSTALVFPAGGHGQVVSDTCATNIARTFLADPSTTPDSTCIQNEPSPNFATRETMVMLPALYKALQGDPPTLVMLLLFPLGVLLLSSSLLIFPIAWIVSRASGPSKPVALEASYETGVPQSYPANDNPFPVGAALTDALDSRPNLWVRLSSWWPVLGSLVNGLFIIGLAITVWMMVSNNDNRIFYGLSGEARPWFILPLLFALLTLLMLISTVSLWATKRVSLLRKLYYAMLAITALGCCLALGWLGMLNGLF